MMQDTPREEKPLGELFGDLTREVTTLIRQEADLAKTELSQKAASVGKDVGFMVAGGAVAYAGLLALVGAAVALLAKAMPIWAAALIMGLVILAVGAFMIQKGLTALRSADLTPRETMEALKGERSASHGRASHRRAVL